MLTDYGEKKTFVSLMQGYQPCILRPTLQEWAISKFQKPLSGCSQVLSHYFESNVLLLFV